MSSEALEQASRRSGQPGRVVHLREAERIATGKAARGEVPRSAHAAWEPDPQRPSPVDLLEPFLGKSEFANHGQRVVEGQRLTQAASDIMLGFIKAEGVDGIKRDFYVRQLWDAKGSAQVELMEPSIMSMYAELCDSELAHARAGDAIAIASYLGTSDTFDRVLAVFAESYADQNERDYKSFAAAVASGQITVETGVQG